MPSDHRTRLARIRRFDQLVAYLRDDMGWPIDSDDFEELTFEYTPEELGIDAKNAAKIQEIKRLRPLVPSQPWGIFFVKFEPKRLPVVALRRILGQVALKKRASANKSERQAWAADDLLFVSNYGEGGERRIAFAHFAKPADGADLPTLKVLGWDNLDTPLHLDDVAEKLVRDLAWPDDPDDEAAWRTRWRSAFTLRHREVVTTSRELSIRLAELARAIRDRIKTALAIETEKGPLTQLMKAFQTALVHDLDADGFADMYAQTIAYGLLSARIADPERKTADDFAAHMRTNPFLRELMETFLKVGGRRGKAGGPGIDFDELGVSEVVELLDDANMEAVILDFGDRNLQEDPVIHFYELFLKEYDAKKRMQRGVFYTPRPVVSYIVRSVDELLRTEFGLADGLADTTTWGEMAKRQKDLKISEGVSPEQDFVQILDPATGTGTFLVEAIDLIHKTLVTKWKRQGHGEKKIDALWNEYVPKHLLTRLHGYELLMAPYAIAHLKIGLKLYETGYRFGSDERARVYLTNALEPAQDFSGQLEFAIPALAHEAHAVNEIKRKQRFTVVTGNPPYSIMSANLSPASRTLVDTFRTVAGARVVEKSAIVLERTLQDDYVKFYGLADRLIGVSSTGLVSLISNNSFLENINLRGMRWRLLAAFDQIYVLDLHGDADRKEVDAFGKDDVNVFEIKKGVAIVAALKRPGSSMETRAEVLRADLLGSRSHKYDTLMASSMLGGAFTRIAPRPEMYSFVSTDPSIADEFARGVPISKLFVESATGIETGKDSILVAFDRQELRLRLIHFGDPTVRDAEIRKEFDAEAGCGRAIADLRKSIPADASFQKRIVPLTFSPFDTRWLFYRKDVINVHSYSVARHVLDSRNLILLVMRQVALGKGFTHVFVTRNLANNRAFYSTRGKAYMFPLWLREDSDELQLSARRGHSNLSSAGLPVGWRSLGSDLEGEEPAYLIMAYVYAVTHSPSYRLRYDAPLRSDYPRIPFPLSAACFDELVSLGKQLVALHLLESPKLDHPITEYHGRRAPEVEKVSWSSNTAWLDKAQTTGFKGVREAVWNFHIGGYQVCEKWLKDRKGRNLSKDDVAHYQKIVVALAETIRLMKEIDEVIEQYGGWPGAFQTSASKATAGQPVLKVAEPRASYGAGKGRDEKRK